MLRTVQGNTKRAHGAMASMYTLAQWLGARLYFPTECSASILFSLSSIFLPILLATGVWDHIYT